MDSARRRRLRPFCRGWCVALVLWGCAAGAPAPPVKTLTADRPTRLLLDNGMRLIVQEHRASDVVALHLWIGAGGRDERPEELGFSHFVEHMLFKGTDRLPPGFVDREVEGVGGRTNAGTSLDYTFYYMLLPARQAMRGIEVMADVAFNAAFDPRELERERQVIFEEIRLGEDNPRSSLFRQLYAEMFPGHPYGRPVLGDRAALAAASRETLRGYYRRHYVPDNMTLVVVGAVDPGDVRDRVTRTFGRVPAAGYRREPLPPQPALDGVRRRQVPRNERQAHVALAWSAPALDHPDAFAVDLLAQILGGSRTSRLNQALRERDRLVSAIRAGYGALQGGGILSVYAQAEPRDLPKVEEAILAEVRRIRDEGVSESERRRAITAAESQHAFQIERAEGLAYAYGLAETVWRLEEELRSLERLRAVTREEIQEAARRYLHAGRFALLAFTPREGGQ
jgi:zinc protease